MDFANLVRIEEPSLYTKCGLLISFMATAYEISSFATHPQNRQQIFAGVKILLDSIDLIYAPQELLWGQLLHLKFPDRIFTTPINLVPNLMEAFIIDSDAKT